MALAKHMPPVEQRRRCRSCRCIIESRPAHHLYCALCWAADNGCASYVPFSQYGGFDDIGDHDDEMHDYAYAFLWDAGDR